MKIGIIGCGNIGAGIARRLAAKHTLSLFDRKSDLVKDLANELKAKACKSPFAVAEASDVVFLTVKPQNMAEVAAALAGQAVSKYILISSLAGTPLRALRHNFGNIPLVRMMPNMAIIYGQGVIGIAEDKELSEKDSKTIEEIIQELGTIFKLPEDKMDALSALTGSGPAFVYAIFESMVDSAIAMGFTASQGRELVLQMISGSLTLLRETKKHPGELKWQVSTPAGVTSAGLHAMEETGVRSGILKTFMAAYKRAHELSSS